MNFSTTDQQKKNSGPVTVTTTQRMKSRNQVNGEPWTGTRGIVAGGAGLTGTRNGNVALSEFTKPTGPGTRRGRRGK